MSAIQSANLATRLWPTLSGSWWRYSALVVLGSLLLWASAKVSVPFWPVPITLQTFAVLLIGLSFGARLATATLALYLCQGAMGLPVFQGTPEKGVGLIYMMGPTGGYLLGFLLAAALAGWLADRGAGRRIVPAIGAALIATALIYLPGVLWLGSVVGWDKPVLELGLYPFILADVLKALLAALIVSATWGISGGRNGRLHGSQDA